MALIDNKLRAATINCKEDCDLVVLDKVHYVRILSKFFTHISDYHYIYLEEFEEIKLHE